jgi:hypothetical protein
VAPEPKTCQSCGRTITWRRKWERSWDEVRYCSRSCRARGVTDEDHRIEDVLRGLLRSAPRGVLDTDLAAALSADGGAEQREPARRAARRLAAAGEVDLVQHGRVVDPSHAVGPVLIRRRR